MEYHQKNITSVKRTPQTRIKYSVVKEISSNSGLIGYEKVDGSYGVETFCNKFLKRLAEKIKAKQNDWYSCVTVMGNALIYFGEDVKRVLESVENDYKFLYE